MKRQLILFAKYPTPGRVKTRLASQVGAERAASLYKEMVETVVAAVLPEDDRYALTCYFDPPGQEEAFRAWLPQLQDFRAQCPGDLGMRMSAALQDSCGHTNHKTVLIGSDCIEITSALIVQAFDQLESHDVILGPARDGGYYLIGMKELHPNLLTGIDWSSERVFAQTLAKAEQAGLSVFLLPILHDIDSV